ncbi:unnamed protein product [Camellia sinensis]
MNHCIRILHHNKLSIPRTQNIGSKRPIRAELYKTSNSLEERICGPHHITSCMACNRLYILHYSHEKVGNVFVCSDWRFCFENVEKCLEILLDGGGGRESYARDDVVFGDEVYEKVVPVFAAKGVGEDPIPE